MALVNLYKPVKAMVIVAATEVAVGIHLLFIDLKLTPIIPFRITQPIRYAVTS